MTRSQERAASLLLTLGWFSWLLIRPAVRVVDDALTWED